MATPTPKAPTFFLDDSGSIVPVAAEEVAGATQMGWVPASPKQISDFQLQEKYGTGLEATKAFAEHAASAATLGLSDVAERWLGISTPEAMAGREQANPLASGAGTATGIAGSLLVPGGELAAPGLLSRAGGAVTRGVAEALPEAAGVAGRLAAKAAASGAGSAIEGAAYGLGQVVHEAALGDPNLTAQSALATIGFSTAIGGALGGAGGVLAQGVKEFTPSDIGGRLSEWLGEFEGERNIKATGAIQSDINRALKTRSRESLNKIGREFADYDLVGPFSTPESTYGKASELIQRGGEQARRLTEAADALPDAQRWTFDEIRSEVEPALQKELRAKGSTIQVATDLEKTLDRYSEAYAGKEMGLADLHALRQDVDDLIYKHGKSLDPFAKDVAKPLKQIRDYLRDELETGVKDAGLPVADWKEAMRMQEVGSTAKRFADKGMTRSHGNNPFGLSATLGAVAGSTVAGPVGGIASLAGTELTRRYASGLLGAGARALREVIDSGAVGSVVNKTADAIAAERSAGIDTIGQSIAAETPRAVPQNPFEASFKHKETGEVVATGRFHDINQLPGGEAADIDKWEAGFNDPRGKFYTRTEARAALPKELQAYTSPAGLESEDVTPMLRQETIRLRTMAAGSAPEKVATLSLLERLAQATGNQIKNRVGSLIRGESAAAGAKVSGSTGEDAAALFRKRTAQVRTLANDPEQLQGKLAAQTDDWHTHAPNTAQALQVTSARAVAFLNSKLPQHQGAGPLAKKWTPTRAEISKFQRYYEAVNKPTSILKQAAQGTLTPEAVEAVATVYPELFQKIRGEVVDQLAGKKAVPYRSKLMLSMLMGQDLDGTTSPHALQRNFAMYAAPPPMPKATPARADS